MNCSLKGRSGEEGCYQVMPPTWVGWSKDYIGYVAPKTPGNQQYVVLHKIEAWIQQGYSDKQIALLYNGGEAKEKRGVNKHGVAYDSGEYANKVLSLLYN